jgi:hypothetical protein
MVSLVMSFMYKGLLFFVNQLSFYGIEVKSFESELISIFPMTIQKSIFFNCDSFYIYIAARINTQFPLYFIFRYLLIVFAL